MLKQKLTILARSVARVGQTKLVPNKIYDFEDSAYLRILIKSGRVTLIDPPSLDPEYLEKAGYELQEGYSYPEPKEPAKEEPKVEKKTAQIPKPPKAKTSEESDSKENVSQGPVAPAKETEPEKIESDHEPSNLQLTPPVGMGVKKSADNSSN